MTFTIDIDDQYIASRIKSELGRLISVHVDLNSLKDLMGDHNSKYWKGAGAPAMQARFLELTKAMNPGME